MYPRRALSTEEKIVTTAVCALGLVLFLSTTRSCSVIDTMRQAIPTTSTEEPLAHPSEVTSAELPDASAAIAKLEEDYNAQLQTLETDNSQLRNALTQRENKIKNLKNQLLEADDTPLYESQEIGSTSTQEVLPPIQEIVRVERGTAVQEQEIRAAIAKANSRHEQERSYLDAEARQLKLELAALKQGHSITGSQQEIEQLQAALKKAQEEKAGLVQQTSNLTDALTLLKKKQEGGPSGPSATLVTPSKPLFASSPDSLGVRERKLFDILSQIDGLKGSALTNKYKELESAHNAKNHGRITFRSGKSAISSAQQSSVTEVTSTYREGTRYLVAGFADISGSLETNRKISSARAKAVAEALAEKVPPSKVQAIYFGQTSRFGTKSQNRAVEIWEIQPTE